LKKIGAVILLLAAVSAGAQKLPAPRLHLPVPQQGATPQPGSTAAGGQALPSNLPSLKLAARIEPVQIFQNEFFSYLIELDWQKSAGSCELEFKLPEVPRAEGLKAVGAEFESETELKAGNSKVSRVYKFQYLPEKSGKTSIPQADFEYRCQGTEPYARVSAPPFPVEVLPKRFHLADLKTSRSFIIFLAIVLLAAVFSSGLMLWRGRKKKAAAKAVELKPTVEEKALEMLKTADQFRIAGKYPDYFLGLERTLKTVLEEKYALRWAGRERLKEEITGAVSSDLAEAVDQFLIISDRVKFAGQEPSSQEMDKSYQVVRRMIEFEKVAVAGGGK